ncbi:MAG: response regulator transcription factor [Bacteroidota bacterium]
MNRIKIILVDDHRIFRDGMMALLNEVADFEVIGDASDAEELLQMIRKKMPDIVIADVTMPGISGIELTRYISREYPCIKVLILSMHENEEFICSAVQAGAMGYLPKDISKNELIDAIKTIYNGKEYFSSTVSEILLRTLVKEAKSRSERDEKDYMLTPREMEVLQYVAKGMSNKEIADQLFISIRTVDCHKNHMIQKLKVRNSAELIAYAVKNGLIQL